MPRTDRLLALDLGTSSARAMVLDGDAAPVPDALERHKVEPSYGEDGAATLDLDGYVDGLFGCIGALQERGLLDGVQHIVMSSQWHSIVALDNNDRPLTPVIPWVDTRSVPRRVGDDFDEQAFHARTGTWLHRLYWTRRIPWLTAEAGATRFAGLPDLVLERLTGHRLSSVSVASGTGMLDLSTGRWDDEALDIAGVGTEALPELVAASWTGELVRECADRWPALTGVPIHPPAGDGAASNVGSGAYQPGTAAVTVGTSAAVRVVHPIEGAPELPWRLWRYRVDDTRAVTGMAFSAAGNLFAWLADLLHLSEAEREPDGIEPGSAQVVAIPFQAGTRPPDTVRSGSGALFGLSFDDTAADVLAAMLQGAALELDRGLHMLDDVFGTLDVVLGGGGVHASPWWRRCMAATFARPAQVCAEAEVGARGAAAIALGLSPEAGGETVTPTDDDIKRMADLKEPYAALRDLAIQAARIPLPGADPDPED
jgi:gluconokinase